MQSSNVLPSFLHQRNEEVDGHSEILPDVVLSGLDVSDGSSQAGSLLGLEFHSVLDLFDLILELFSFSKSDWEESHLHKHVA